ncbi:hypothetical protein NC651_019768 [Populus alba x Populus x berolinensis]|nr:hypothetical protein NC651_019768 [Populus alba x Populus x berolinensis]
MISSRVKALQLRGNECNRVNFSLDIVNCGCVTDAFFSSRMFDDQDLGFFANFLGIFIFVLVIAYHYVMADPKYEGN